MATNFSQQTAPTLTEAIRLGVEEGTEDLRVALPAKVVSYDSSNQTATVKPLIKNWVRTSEGVLLDFESIPVIYNVPIMFPRSGQYAITFPIAEGDKVLLVFNDLNIANYVEGDGSESDPQELSRHALDDAVAIPGFFSKSEALSNIPADAVCLGKEGEAIDAAALASLVDARIAQIKAAVDAAAAIASAAAPPTPASNQAAIVALQTALTTPLVTLTTASNNVKIKETAV